MGSDRTSFPASFPIARLERRTSAKGNEYFSGFLGGARVSLIKSTEIGRDGCEIWHLMLAEGKMFPMKDSALKPDASPTHDTPRSPRVSKREAAMRDYAAPSQFVPTTAPSAEHFADNEIPF